jgi:hypothetical protein
MTGFPAASGPPELVVTTAPTVVPQRVATAPAQAPVGHQIAVVDGRFAAAHCSCGWRSAGRRSRATVRAEARDHALLYADGRTAGS